MDSLYAQYLRERTQDKILETAHGFATYRYLSKDQVYIMDIFVLPGCRKLGIASNFADKICEEAKANGCKELLGTINPSTSGAHESMLTLIAYGMKVHSSQNNVIIFKKDL